jgi:hypothetical protein
MLVAPENRSAVIARLRKAAMTCGAGRGAVLVESHVADPVQSVLDAPVPSDPAGEQTRVGVEAGQAGDRVDGDGLHLPPGAAGDAGAPACARECGRDSGTAHAADHGWPDPAAQVWLSAHLEAGIEGVVAKRLDHAYSPGKRAW